MEEQKFAIGPISHSISATRSKLEVYGVVRPIYNEKGILSLTNTVQYEHLKKVSAGNRSWFFIS